MNTRNHRIFLEMVQYMAMIKDSLPEKPLKIGKTIANNQGLKGKWLMQLHMLSYILPC